MNNICLAILIFFSTQMQAYGNSYHKPVGKCLSNSDWFSSPVAAPEEGIGSPFAFVNGEDESTNCDFHQWSWNKFLYLMQTDKKTGDLVIFGPDFFQVDNKMAPYFEPWNDRLNPTGGKLLTSLVLDDITQADDTTLYTKLHNSPIRYSIHINNTFYKSAINAIKDGVKSTDEFKVGSVEIKAAWVDVTQLKILFPAMNIQENFYIRKALIENDSVYKSYEEVALLGIHVVGVVENHPEFIWATFEHDKLSPDYFKGPTNQPNYYNSTTPISDSEDYILYHKNTRGQDVLFDSGSNVSNTFRMFQYGVPTGLPYLGKDKNLNASEDQRENDGDTFSNISQINKDVNKKLTKESSIWSNYFYSGSIWLSTETYEFTDGISGNIVGDNANSNLRGSLGLANITMETTFQVSPNPNKKPQKMVADNCFTCHGIGKNKSTMHVSHIFNNLLKSIPSDMIKRSP